ncbi:unnamed protein product [Staurois parvus]|uniref:Uncharacterized protein n=1 Tax=Staurois parvus TaxID=386267 RepID=A0ABN9DW81_9NEOB|nr:unnamed protein product [Staurois parvus]
MGPPTDPGPSGSARVSKWSVRPCGQRSPVHIYTDWMWCEITLLPRVSFSW